MSSQISPQTNTGGGAIIQGSVTVSENGLFVGRDYITIQKTVYDFDQFFFRIFTKLGWFRLKRLEELKAFSKGRCLERWLALGIPDEKATSFLENPAFDRSERITGLYETESLKILIGDFGVGKSLIVEKLFQKLVDEAIHQKRSPIPIFISSSQLSGNLLNDINNEASLIGNINKLGARVIVDGADEVSSGQAEILLQQAITITKSNLKISILITSRPISVFEKESLKRLSVPELSNNEISAIVIELSEHEKRQHVLYGLPQPVIDALKKPFFAVLYGLYRRQLNQGVFKSQGELISHLVEMIVKKIEDNQVLDLLEKLAMLSIEREGKYILISDIGSDEQIKLLLKSRLVIARQKLIGFALPILAQWFAAKSIENNKIPIHELTKSLLQIEKWRYPLMVLVSNASFEKISHVLTPIAEKHPSILPEIINGAINGFGESQVDDVGLPTAKEMGERIVQSMQAISNGLVPIAQFLSPVTREGKISKIGVHKNDKWFSVLWYGDIQEEGVVELPEGFGQKFQRGKYPWREMRGLRPGVQSAWVWLFSLNQLKERMRSLVDHKALPLIAGSIIYRELMWKLALETMGQGELSHRPILLSELRVRLNPLRIPSTSLQHLLLSYLDNLEENREEYITPLWPSPDMEDYHQGGWIWTPYSPERLLERQKLVLEAALTEYSSLVNNFFFPLKERLTIYITLPAKLVGYLDYSGEYLGMDWYFDPLPQNEKSSIDIRLSNEHLQFGKLVDSNELFEKFRKLRPRLSRYHGFRSQIIDTELFGPSPVTDLVYKWLSEDLRDISWIT
jgi:hypothetical protein